MAENLYTLPNNWRWTTLGEVSENQYGYTAKAEKNNSLPKMLRITDIQNGVVDWENVPNCQINDEQRKKYLLNNNDIVIARTGSVGKSYIVKNPVNSVFASYLIRLKIFSSADANFVYYFLQSDLYWKQISELASGSVQLGVNSTKLQNMKFPLPPLDEQKRIVTLLDSFFEKLDAAKEIAKGVIDSYELRRAAILHKAFTGELSEKWRVENGCSLDDWQTKKISDVAKIGSGGTPSRKKLEYYGGNIAWVKTGEILWNEIFDTEEKITTEALNNSSAKIYPIGTVLVAMYGQGLTRGRAGILKIEASTNQAVCALCPFNDVYNKYLYYFFMANYWQLREKAFGGNQPNYSATMISKLEIDIPPLSEQKEIARLLDSLLDKDQRTKEIAEKVLQQIDTLKKNILARAFRGELGTN